MGGTLLMTLNMDSLNAVAFSSDGSCIVSGSRDKSVRVWDALTVMRSTVPWKGKQTNTLQDDTFDVRGCETWAQ